MPKLSDTKFIVLDTETTGADPSKDKPIELAYVVVENFKIERPKSWFIDPQRPIPPEASAVHHLVDADVAGSKTLEELWPEVATELAGQVIVAHNAQFDISMLPGLKDNPVLCTLRLARQLWPKGQVNARGFPLINHQQQVLRYWLGLEINTMGLQAHRAAADILVTAELLLTQIRLYLECGGEDDLNALLDFVSSPIEVKTLSFGKHANEPLPKVPTTYLEYLIDKDKERPLDADLKASIKRELDTRKGENIIASRTPQQKNA
jgi:exodeoxyribonuclease X